MSHGRTSSSEKGRERHHGPRVVSPASWVRSLGAEEDKEDHVITNLIVDSSNYELSKGICLHDLAGHARS